MKPQRFFRNVWRLNAILLLLVTLAVFVAMVSLLGSEIASIFRPHPAAVTPAVIEPDSPQPLALGATQIVPGTTILRRELTRTASGRSFGSSSATSEIHNILFINPTAGTSHWLLPTHRTIIAYNEEVFPGGLHPGEERTPIASIILVKQEGENVDGRLFAFNPTGEGLVEVARGVRAIENTIPITDAEVLIVFDRGEKEFAIRLALPGFRTIGERELPVPTLDETAPVTATNGGK